MLQLHTYAALFHPPPLPSSLSPFPISYSIPRTQQQRKGENCIFLDRLHTFTIMSGNMTYKVGIPIIV